MSARRAAYFLISICLLLPSTSWGDSEFDTCIEAAELAQERAKTEGTGSAVELALLINDPNTPEPYDHVVRNGGHLAGALMTDYSYSCWIGRPDDGTLVTHLFDGRTVLVSTYARGRKFLFSKDRTEKDRTPEPATCEAWTSAKATICSELRISSVTKTSPPEIFYVVTEVDYE